MTSEKQWIHNETLYFTENVKLYNNNFYIVSLFVLYIYILFSILGVQKVPLYCGNYNN